MFPSVTLREGELVLRQLIEADVSAVTDYGADELTQTWLPLPNPYTEEHSRWFCTELAPARQQSGEGLVLGIEFGSQLAGVIDLKRTDWAARTTEIGYWTAPWARGHGVMSSALSCLSRWVLSEQGFARVEVRVATGNWASQRVAEKAGFTREGVLRSAGYVHAGRVDLVVFSLVDTDRTRAGSGTPVPSGL